MTGFPFSDDSEDKADARALSSICIVCWTTGSLPFVFAGGAPPFGQLLIAFVISSRSVNFLAFWEAKLNASNRSSIVAPSRVINPISWTLCLLSFFGSGQESEKLVDLQDFRVAVVWLHLAT